MTTIRWVVGLLLVLLLAAGCGGGGGDSDVTNAAPVANAGAGQSVVVGSVVTLNGSASSDANSDPLSYSWALSSRPAGSAATLTGATSAAPTFTADTAGMYVASLVVNDGRVSSAASTVAVAVTVANAAPVANAGTVQNVVTGTLVTLNGSASSDANGDQLTYAWTLTSKPAGGTATLTGATSATPTFTADVDGTYVAALVVNDGTVSSSAASVTVTATTANAAPIADAGTAQNVFAGTTATLNGSASSDANSDPLTYAWTLTSKPAGSNATLVEPNASAPTFAADIAGLYVASLIVNDGTVNSAPATVMITASERVVLDQQYDPGSSFNVYAGVSSNVDRAQTFTTLQAGKLETVSLLLSKSNDVAVEATFEIRRTANGVPVEDDSAVLFAKTISSDQVPLGNGFIAIDVSAASISVVSGDTIAIVLRPKQYSLAPVSNAIWWLGRNYQKPLGEQDPYPRGKGYQRSPLNLSNWANPTYNWARWNPELNMFTDDTSSEGGDYGFKVNVNTAISTTP